MRNINAAVSFILTLSLLGSSIHAEAFSGKASLNSDMPVICEDYLSSSEDIPVYSDETTLENDAISEDELEVEVLDNAKNDETQAQDDMNEDENEEETVGAVTSQITVTGGMEGVDYSKAENGTLTVMTSTPLVLDGGGRTITEEQIVLGTTDRWGDINVTIKDLNITKTSSVSPIKIVDNFKNNVNLTIEGTSVLMAGPDHAGIEKNSVSADGILTISGTGTLTVSGGELGAGIGSGFGKRTANIVIDGGTIIAYGGREAAGIGAGKADASEYPYLGGKAECITINDGKVTSTGGFYGAGIGGGCNGGVGQDGISGAYITINGGEVITNGGTYGAGIGGSYRGGASNITINNGTITANGGSFGAGIGGGGKCSYVTINGGYIIATGGTQGAGIGGGAGGSGSYITIKGGTVYALAPDSAGSAGAGIGGGYSAGCSYVTISGGNVEVVGKSGIGSGSCYDTSDIYISGGNLKTPIIGTTPKVSESDGRPVSLKIVRGYLSGEIFPFESIKGASYYNIDNTVAYDDGCFYFYLPENVDVSSYCKCIVIFETNCDMSVPAQSLFVGDKVVEPTGISNPGFVLKGWYTSKTSSSDNYKWNFNEDQVKENITLYAFWEKEAQVKVSFDANGGSVNTENKTVNIGSKYGQLPIPVRNGYIFDGWYTEKEEGERIDESSIVTITEDHTLYAHWGNTPVESVTLDKKTLQMLIGEEAQLTATVSPADATNLKVIWSSSDNTVASVSDGKVSANKAGKAVITATTEDGGYTDTCEVTVSTAYKLTFMVDDAVYATIFVKEGQVAEKVDPPVSDRKFVGWYYNDQLWNPSSPVYSDMVLVAHFKDEAEEESGSALDSQPDLNADSIILVKGQKFVVEGDGWISSDKSVLTVNKKGNVTAKKPTSSVTLSRVVDGKTIKSIKVIILQPSIEPGVVLYVGKDKKISLTGITGLNAIWISSATDVAVVDNEGVVQALSKGTATISAIINGVEFKCKVTVKDADTSKKDFSRTVELVPMQSTNVKVNGFKASKATWSSDLEAVPASKLSKGVVYENAVVRITKSGKLTAIGVGETELTATSGSAALKFKIVVSAPVTQIVHLNVNSSKTIKIYGTKGALAWRGEVNGLQITKNKIKALSSGMRTITAQYENFEYKVIIYAEDPSIVTKEISGAYPKYTLQMKVGETVAITEKETYQNILYRSNKNNIAFADEAGVITARSSGKATITAKVNGKKITIVVNVTG